MNKESGIRVRIAPSPTGYMHVGTARAALFNYLFARQNSGSFVLRLEDTDPERSKAEFEPVIYNSLEWLGIIPDESPAHGGQFGPYRQTERAGKYREALQRLLREGKAFYCSHKREEGEHEVHWCELRDEKGTEGNIRFKTPKGRVITFSDAIRGKIAIDTDTIGDFSIARNIDSALYNFAVAVDDETMKITHVIRGEDHIANTPKQILILKALGHSIPNYAHLPLLLGTDRSKMSKRHGSVSVTDFRERGYLPEALVNFLALLGWNPGTDREIFSLSELVQGFSLDNVQKSGAIFDVTKLDWMNGEYIRMKSVSRLLDLLTPFIKKAGIDVSNISREKLERIVALEQPRLKTLAEIGERIHFYFMAPDPNPELLIWKKMGTPEVAASLDESIEILSRVDSDQPSASEVEGPLLEAATKRGDRGSLLWPLRVALTGLKASPGPFDVISVLGKTESLKRLQKAKEALK